MQKDDLGPDEFELDGHTYRLDFSGENLAQADFTLSSLGLKMDAREAFGRRTYLGICVCVAALISTETRRMTWKRLSRLIDKVGRHKYAEIEAKASKLAVQVYKDLGVLEDDEVDSKGEGEAGARPATPASASSGSPGATS